MHDYTIYYRNGDKATLSAPDRVTLVNDFFGGDEDRFKSEVSKISWRTLTAFYTEDVQSGEIQADLATADINPYGWRNA